MEKLLARIARQLDAVDEASLMSLWNKYATIASRFEPTKRWEEAVLIFSLIQAKHMKNINDLSRIKVSVPDVKPGDPGADAIYSLYAKGVLTGVDSKLTFNPKGTVTRAEAAAIVARMARAEQRLTLWGTFNPNVLAA